MIEQICQKIFGAPELKDKPVMPVLLEVAEQRAVLDDCSSERLVMANGRKALPTYTKDSSPVMSARFQELCGVKPLFGSFACVGFPCFLKLPATLARDERPLSRETVLSFAYAHQLHRELMPSNLWPFGVLNSDHYWGVFYCPIIAWSFGFSLCPASAEAEFDQSDVANRGIALG